MSDSLPYQQTLPAFPDPAAIRRKKPIAMGAAVTLALTFSGWAMNLEIKVSELNEKVASLSSEIVGMRSDQKAALQAISRIEGYISAQRDGK